jgi:membrane protease subunit HflK
MPWSNQNGGGGPWGGGGNKNQGPWNQGPNRPRGGGNTPPDLDEIIRRSQDRLKTILPGGFNGGIAIIALILVIGFWLMQAVYTVQPDERGVESVFGKPKDEIAGPGLHFMFWPIETVELVNVTEQQQKIGTGTGQQGEGLMLTGDQNIVNVQFSVLFSVTDPRAYLYNVAEPGKTLSQVADSVMREVVGRRPAQDIFRDNRQAIAQEVKDAIQKTIDNYHAGIAVNTISIEDVSPPKEVSSAFDEVQRAEQDEDKMIEQANQYANKVRGQANGEAAKIREEAAAYKNRIVKEAEGEAARFLSVYEQYKKAPEITRKRLYLETMEKVLTNSRKVITDTTPGSNGVLPLLPLNDLAKPSDKGVQK